MLKRLKRIIVKFGAIITVAAALIGVFALDTWYRNSYKTHVQTLQFPAGKAKFVLLTDKSGFGDRAWYVYLMPSNAEITDRMKAGHDTAGALFWNYSEGGNHYDSPRIEIRKERYLVFYRGGLLHSLYDIGMGQLLVNDESPWSTFMSSQEKSSKSARLLPPQTMDPRMDEWVRNNLHLKIQKILTDAT